MLPHGGLPTSVHCRCVLHNLVFDEATHMNPQTKRSLPLRASGMCAKGCGVRHSGGRHAAVSHHIERHLGSVPNTACLAGLHHQVVADGIWRNTNASTEKLEDMHGPPPLQSAHASSHRGVM